MIVIAAVKKIDRKLEVYAASCPLFVPLAEEGWTDKKVALDIAGIYLRPLKAKRVDTLVLGCTHYPLLKTLVRETLGPRVRLIDSAEISDEAAEEEEDNGFNPPDEVAAHAELGLHSEISLKNEKFKGFPSYQSKRPLPALDLTCA